jgi:hypothetical protein
METKAIYLELSNLTSEAFIAALKSFIARRGLIKHQYSNNDSNLVGAKEVLMAFVQSEEFLWKIHDYAAETRFQWHFIPPNSPQLEGLWESGVKSLKYYWKRISSKTLLSFEELSTFITQTERSIF